MVYAALLRDGHRRRQLMTSSAVFFAPQFLRMEIEKHRLDIVRRSGGSADAVDAVLTILYRRISWVADDQIRPHLPLATKLLGRVDPNDVPYLACAFAVDADGIWSGDPHFDQQSLVPRTADPT